MYTCIQKNYNKYFLYTGTDRGVYEKKTDSGWIRGHFYHSNSTGSDLAMVP